MYYKIQKKKYQNKYIDIESTFVNYDTKHSYYKLYKSYDNVYKLYH